MVSEDAQIEEEDVEDIINKNRRLKLDYLVATYFIMKNTIISIDIYTFFYIMILVHINNLAMIGRVIYNLVKAR